MKERLVALLPLVKKVLPKIGYPLVYLFCLILFSSWTFPYGRLKDRIVAGFNAQQRAGGSHDELEIEDMGSSFITGVKMKGVKLTSAPAAAAANPLAPAKEAKPPSEMKIEEVTARISLLPLLIGNKDVGFHVKAFGGRIDGSFDDHGEKEKDFSAKLDSVDLGQITALADTVTLPIEGILSGSINIEMPEGKAAKANGSVSLEIEGLALGDGKAKFKDMVAPPKASIGTFSFVADAKDGQLKVSKLGGAGKDIEIQGDGKIILRDVPTESNCDLNVRFKVNDAYRAKNEVTKSLFGAPGTGAGALLEMDPKVKQAKRPDGFYAFRARGMLAHLDFAPQLGTATPFSPPSRPGGGMGAPPGGGP